MTITKLRYRAVAGSLLSDPKSPGRFLGRKALPMPPDGWPPGTKPEERHPIDEAGGEVDRTDRRRYAVVLDALQKGIDLEPLDTETARLAGIKLADPAAPEHRNTLPAWGKE